jgi:hypothetical protein
LLQRSKKKTPIRNKQKTKWVEKFSPCLEKFIKSLSVVSLPTFFLLRAVTLVQYCSRFSLYQHFSEKEENGMEIFGAMSWLEEKRFCEESRKMESDWFV